MSRGPACRGHKGGSGIGVSSLKASTQEATREVTVSQTQGPPIRTSVTTRMIAMKGLSRVYHHETQEEEEPEKSWLRVSAVQVDASCVER